jgi:hypothetical protein
MAESNSTVGGITSKFCAKCQNWKFFQDFAKDKNRKDGHYPYCKHCVRQQYRSRVAKDPEAAKQANREYYSSNRQVVRQRAKKWVAENRQRANELARLWAKSNPERYAATRARAREARRSDVRYVLGSRVAQRLRVSLKTGKGGVATFDLLGYTAEDLRAHIGKQFTKGMTWERFMTGEIHIDHIQPLSSFDYVSTSCASFKAAWCLSNLRPLWKDENLRKHAKPIFLL